MLRENLKENVASVTLPEIAENFLHVFAWYGDKTEKIWIQLNHFNFRDESDLFTENIEIS